MKISDYLRQDHICFLSSSDRNSALKALVENLAKSNQITDKDSFYCAILEREKISSTGIGIGIAIPHAKLPSIKHFFLSIGILSKGIEWSAIDGQSVRAIFLIGGPDNNPSLYLQILSQLTQLLRNEELRKKIFSSSSAHELLKLFENSSIV